jgi:hypothetical protein
MTVGGQVISVTTTAGMTAAQVAQALANAINANAVLQAAGITATAQGSRVITDGDISGSTVTDSGLQSVLDLRVEKTRLWWGTIGGVTAYDLVRGDLGALRSTAGNFGNPTATQLCLANDRVDTYWAQSDQPSPGQAAWYLLRGTPGGSYDDGSASQIGSRDAEITASGNGCP